MAKKKLGFGLMRLPLVDQNEAAWGGYRQL